ncbi:hypothetical protein AAFF_G00090020 [Aldrovandia affinis]|uniref:Uncharacterized protein n=1 Tax=Aldrovandia affinis TaxID=143900 RepID=A0AAD7RW61_9TELE|nr:hypothetical protein AAFF_G00090020 [Aldrovandia affinis]
MMIREKATKQRDGEKQAQAGTCRSSVKMRLCFRCGGEHQPRQCPAFGKQCHFCAMKNHFSRVCRQQRQPKKVHRIKKDNGSSNTSREFSVGSVGLTEEEDEWNATYSANGTDIFQIGHRCTGEHITRD